MILHSIFIYSLIDGHFDGFHILPIVNNAEMKMEVQTLFKILILFPSYI